MRKALLPWERQPGESGKAYTAFCIYRDLGRERTLIQTSQQVGKYRSLIDRWSAMGKWKDRALAWDAHIDRKVQAATEREKIKMVERHAKQAMLFQQKIFERMQTMTSGELTPSDMVKWFDIAVKIERLSRGESTETTKHVGTLDIVKKVLEMTPEERQEKIDAFVMRRADSMVKEPLRQGMGNGSVTRRRTRVPGTP